MTTKSNFGLIGLVLVACLFISQSTYAQLYGDVNDINGQTNIGIGLSSPSAKLHLYNSGSTTSLPTTLRIQQQIGGNYSNGIWDFSVNSGSLFLNYNVYRYFTNHSGTALSIGYDNVIQDHKISMFEQVVFSKDVEFKRNVIISDGSGTTQFKISNTGFVRARQIDVNLDPIPDYVFEKDYDLMSLTELSNYIKKYKHLPKIKSAAEYEEVGSINVGELQLQLLEKVEELTLYTIQQQTEIDALKKENKNLVSQVEKLNKQLEKN